jgi:co-chaperonin GroES (HSP10)
MKLQGKAVLIYPDQLPEKSKGGISIPRTAKEQPQTGVVVDHGPGCELVRKGCRVQFNRRSASIYEEDGKQFYFTTEEENKIFYIE